MGIGVANAAASVTITVGVATMGGVFVGCRTASSDSFVWDDSDAAVRVGSGKWVSHQPTKTTPPRSITSITIRTAKSGRRRRTGEAVDCVVSLSNRGEEAGETNGVIKGKDCPHWLQKLAVSGWARPQHGTVFIEGKPYRNAQPHQMQKAGLARSFQITNLFFDLPVAENLRLAAQVLEPKRLWTMPVSASRRAAEVVEQLRERFGLQDKAG